jgi:hypothetical protein
MTNPRNIFIKIPPEWSYAYIGAMREFIPLDSLVISKLYAVACHFVVLRHNFIWGHMDNVRYTCLVEDQFRPYASYGLAVGNMKFYLEDLYRRMRPILDGHPGMLKNALFWNDDAGDVIGTVFEYVQPYPIESRQFA